jgi:hypothetical protein
VATVLTAKGSTMDRERWWRVRWGAALIVLAALWLHSRAGSGLSSPKQTYSRLFSYGNF